MRDSRVGVQGWCRENAQPVALRGDQFAYSGMPSAGRPGPAISPPRTCRQPAGRLVQVCLAMTFREHLVVLLGPLEFPGVTRGKTPICFSMFGLREPSFDCSTPVSDWATPQTKPRPLASGPGCLKSQAQRQEMCTWTRHV